MDRSYGRCLPSPLLMPAAPRARRSPSDAFANCCTYRSNIGSRSQLAFPFGDNGSGDTVADDVGCRTAHVEEVVDSEQEQESGFGDIELRERRSDDDE